MAIARDNWEINIACSEWVEIFNWIAQKAKTFSGHLGASVTRAVELANCDD